MCGSDQATLLVETSDLLYAESHSSATFRLLTCLSCGHIYQNPRPTVEAIDAFYPQQYMRFEKAIDDEAHWWRRIDRRRGVHRRCKAIHRAVGRAGRILDVGCATGLFLDGMRTFGWQVHGVEISQAAAGYARARFGIPVFQGRLEESNFESSSFDVVTFWDVLEHVHEPKRVLAEVARILRPNGLLVVGIPNPDSLEARLLGQYWLGWDLPRHLNLFRPLTLKYHFAALGFETESIRSFTAGYGVLILSLENWLRAKRLNAEVIGKFLRIWPLRLLTLPYYAGPANWYNLSSIMVVFARRKTTA